MALGQDPDFCFQKNILAALRRMDEDGGESGQSGGQDKGNDTV